ncbi:MAG: hypothetical protein LBU00_06150 [Treponema sp.]|jgi:hypothetical protein|nr:hypothetical protein [Treponema sp.]
MNHGAAPGRGHGGPDFPALPRLSVSLCRVLLLGLALPVFSLGRGDTVDSGPPSGAVPVRPSGSADVPPVPPESALPALSVPGPGGAPLREGDWVELEGRVRLLGAEPFPDLVLTDGTGQDWYLEGPARRALQAYEQRTVRVRGRVELREMVLANGRSLGIRRGLSELRLLD